MKILIALLVLCASAFSQEYLQPIKSTVVYRTVKHKDTVVVVTVKDKLVKVKEKRGYYKVKILSHVGWVDTSDVIIATGKHYKFGDANINGYLDDNTPIYIIDANTRPNPILKIERSFFEELKNNIDRETIERLEED
jgi:hypothetical protein|tara:strand:+ start:10565 stop:10975 length:411 start_codon:yes stop_codon:yes gene_type:complete